ncbi:MAG: hypothetical protein ACLTW9_20750 [Enterocloster sp.]
MGVTEKWAPSTVMQRERGSRLKLAQTSVSPASCRMYPALRNSALTLATSSRGRKGLTHIVIAAKG